MARGAPSYGDVWFADFDPTEGREQAGRRPALVISADQFNHGPSGLVIVVALTTRDWELPVHVPLDPPEGGVRERSYAMCEMVRSISRERLVDYWGNVSRETMRQVVMRLRLLMPAP